jgi:hypothetical protein
MIVHQNIHFMIPDIKDKVEWSVLSCINKKISRLAQCQCMQLSR